MTIGSLTKRFDGVMKISIVTVAYNAEATIAQAVKSVVDQVGSAFELEYLIIDGDSNDGTLAAIDPFRERITAIISEPDLGLYDAMNKGIAAATGDFVGILNADDCYSNEFVLQGVAETLNSTSADSLYGDLVYVNEENEVVRYWKSRGFRKGKFNTTGFLNGWMPPHPTFFLRRTTYQLHGTFNLQLKSAADYELMLRMLFKHGVSTAYLPKVLVRMRTGGVSNANWSNRLKANREDHKAWSLNDLSPQPWTLLAKPLRKLPQWWSKP
jgi:glycosyltransferase